MSKKILAILVIAVMIIISITPAFAEGAQSIVFSLNKLTFTVNDYITGSGIVYVNGIPIGNKSVTMTVESLDGKSLYDVEQYTTDSAGKFIVRFRMLKSAELGTYNIKLKSYETENTIAFKLVEEKPTKPSDDDDDDEDTKKPQNAAQEKETDQGTATTTRDANGDITVTLKLDSAKVEALIENETSNIVKINALVDENAKTIKVQMDSSLLEKAKKNNKSLEINAGDTTITIDPGALDVEEKSQVTLTIKRLSDEEAKAITSQLGAEAFNSAAYVFDFDLISTLGDRIEKVKLNKPLTITMKYDPQKVTEPRKLGVYYYNESTSAWEYIAGKVTEEGTIEFTVNHLSKYTVFEYNKVFEDVDIPWAKEAIDIMAARHVIDGVSGGKFAPNENVTKAQFTKMIVKALDLKVGNTNVKFTDIIQGAWYEEYVNIAASLGITEGSNGQFKPNEQITREAMAVMVVRALNLVDELKDTNSLTLNLSDQNEISDWAKNAVVIAYSKAIVTGTTNSTFAPKDNATRAQATVIIYRLFTAIQSEK